MNRSKTIVKVLMWDRTGWCVHGPYDFQIPSLCAGFATVAAMNGATEHEIQRTAGHVSLEVLRRYIRDGELFKKNAARKLGL